MWVNECLHSGFELAVAADMFFWPESGSVAQIQNIPSKGHGRRSSFRA
jgi:hypothetical protein